MMKVRVSRRGIKKRRFTPEFKTDAVKLVQQGERSIREVASSLGVSYAALARWVGQAETDAGNGPPGALTTDERAELQQLRRELERVKMEREILKKAAAFFAKENG
jgi:transposase-like protein